MSDILLWFDLETTGLDETNDSILEVGWGISETNLDWVMEPKSYLIDNVFLLHKGKTLVNGREVDPYVEEMHQKSGLWGDLETQPSLSLADCSATILSVISAIPGVEKVTMAGSGVAQFDMRWVRRMMPRLHERLTYYTIDMGIFERVESLLRGGSIRPSRGNAAHRAVDDIEFAHRLAVRYKELLLVGADFDRANP